MRIVAIAALAPALFVSLVSACAHNDETGRPTTLTSAAPPPEPAGARPQDRIADELCRREDACGRVNRGGRYPSLETCMQDLSLRVGRELSQWRCSPAASRARFEECLAGIRTETCQTVLDRADRVPACRSNVVCGI